MTDMDSAGISQVGFKIDWIKYELESGRKYSYREIDDLSDGLAAGFYRLGIRGEDKVAIFAYNSPEWLLSYFAILKLGAVPVTVNTGFIKDPLAYNLQASNSGFLIVDTRLHSAYKQVEANLTEIRSLILIGSQKDSRDQVLLPAKAFSNFHYGWVWEYGSWHSGVRTFCSGEPKEEPARQLWYGGSPR